MHTQDTDYRQYILSAAATILKPLQPEITPQTLADFLDEKFEPRNAERLLTRLDFSRQTRLSMSTTDRLIKSGEIEVIRIRRSIRIPESAVAALLAGNTSASEQQSSMNPAGTEVESDRY